VVMMLRYLARKWLSIERFRIQFLHSVVCVRASSEAMLYYRFDRTIWSLSSLSHSHPRIRKL
jgi:hypothetical protein